MQFVSDAQTSSVNADARLDRLPVCSFHWRIPGADLRGHVPRNLRHLGVLGAVLNEGWSTIELNAANNAESDTVRE